MGPRPMAGGGGGVEIVSLGNLSPVGGPGRGTPVDRQQRAFVRAMPSTGVGRGQDPREDADNAVGQGVGAGVGPGSGSESGTDSLLTEIRKRIERAKGYPSFARQQGIEGVAEVRFQINPDGSLGVNQVVRSSGSALLDEAALATLRRATPYPAYPDPLQVKIEFSLRD